jgi:hypothetical protein
LGRYRKRRRYLLGTVSEWSGVGQTANSNDPIYRASSKLSALI